MYDLPKTQRAVQLIGAEKLLLNESKSIVKPGPHQILGKIEAVGLCFSDLKLLKQFTGHARKSEITAGIEPEVLKQISSYAPGEAPGVPGHEAVVRVVAVGTGVKGASVGNRYLVQTDYRWLPTKSSNAAFGYNFEGGLQEYVLMDERVITSPKGESMLIPASEKISASAVALVEPWACVENAYAAGNRTTLKKNGQMLIVADVEPSQEKLKKLFDKYGMPAKISWYGKDDATAAKTGAVIVESIEKLTDATYDDVIYFGANAETTEKLFAKVAAAGLFNIVLGGQSFGRTVMTAVGRVHYGGIRIIGTVGNDPSDGMSYIPATGEIRPNDKISVVGAGGPMGLMHVVRNLCQGVKGITVYAGDLDNARLAMLNKVAEPAAKRNKVGYVPYNPKEADVSEKMNYVSLMAPVPALVAQAVEKAADGGIINIFAGIPATVSGQVNLDSYIQKKLFFIGTSGSVLDDMKCVLNKVQTSTLDTDISVAAVCGLDGAIEGITAVEKALIPGKIIVYPMCKGLGLTRLEELKTKYPDVAKKLADGIWNIEAERALLKNFAG